MKKLILTLIPLFIYTQARGMDANDLLEVETVVARKAEAFGKERANPHNMWPAWKAAYIAYAYNEMKQNKSPSTILSVVQKLPNSSQWNDEALGPYWTQAIDWNNNGALDRSIATDWQAVCALYSQSSQYRDEWKNLYDSSSQSQEGGR